MSATTWTCTHCRQPVPNDWPLDKPHCDKAQEAHVAECKRKHAEELYCEVQAYAASLIVRHANEEDEHPTWHKEIKECLCNIAHRYHNVEDLLRRARGES